MTEQRRKYNRRKLRYLILTALISLILACNNYGLVEKLENPDAGLQTFADRLYAFVTSATTAGDMLGLTAPGCSANGIQRADCHCQRTAATAGLLLSPSSRFVAWLSDDNNDMTCRLQGQSGRNCAAPASSAEWYNSAKQRVAIGYNAPTGIFYPTGLTALPGYSETGVSHSGAAWTGTNGNGTTMDGETCNNWSSANNGPDIGRYGIISVTPFAGIEEVWTAEDNPYCDFVAHVYCFAVP